MDAFEHVRILPLFESFKHGAGLLKKPIARHEIDAVTWTQPQITGTNR